MGVHISIERENFEGEGRPIAKCSELCQNGRTDKDTVSRKKAQQFFCL